MLKEKDKLFLIGEICCGGWVGLEYPNLCGAYLKRCIAGGPRTAGHDGASLLPDREKGA